VIEKAGNQRIERSLSDDDESRADGGGRWLKIRNPE
jgi:hypothetical protein